VTWLRLLIACAIGAALWFLMFWLLVWWHNEVICKLWEC